MCVDQKQSWGMLTRMLHLSLKWEDSLITVARRVPKSINAAIIPAIKLQFQLKSSSLDDDYLNNPTNPYHLTHISHFITSINMRFVTLIFAALAAGPLAALAAPAPADNAASEKSCPSGGKINCGVSFIFKSSCCPLASDIELQILMSIGRAAMAPAAKSDSTTSEFHHRDCIFHEKYS